jgi:SAM-dependent methyltransferase
MPFVVPPEYLRNAQSVLDMGPPADIGAQLMDYMARRLGHADLAGLDVLDMGCGTRFADTLMNRPVAIGSYTGIEVNPTIVRFLVANATDPRLRFHHFDAHNPHYNPNGRALTADRTLPVGDARFDVVCMFSVVTHLPPDEARAMFTMLRKYVRPDGRLFFSVYLDDEAGADYYEGMPEHPALMACYSGAHLRRLLAETGWREVSYRAQNDEDQPIMDSFVCAPM